MFHRPHKRELTDPAKGDATSQQGENSKKTIRDTTHFPSIFEKYNVFVLNKIYSKFSTVSSLIKYPSQSPSSYSIWLCSQLQAYAPVFQTMPNFSWLLRGVYQGRKPLAFFEVAVPKAQFEYARAVLEGYNLVIFNIIMCCESLIQ